MSERPPTIGSARLLLRPFTMADIVDGYIQWLNDPKVVRFSNQRFRRHDVESCLAYLHSFSGSENMFLAICMLNGNRMIGTMTAYISPYHGTADMGILVGERSVWGQGVGLEAWSLLMLHLLQGGSCRKVTGGALRCNIGMVKIMERSGMHLEAVRAKQEIVDGNPQDALYFAKFRDE